MKAAPILLLAVTLCICASTMILAECPTTNQAQKCNTHIARCQVLKEVCYKDLSIEAEAKKCADCLGGEQMWTECCPCFDTCPLDYYYEEDDESDEYERK